LRGSRQRRGKEYEGGKMASAHDRSDVESVEWSGDAG
jgi:hypothetical protein